MSMEDMTKAMTGETAKCQMSWNTPGNLCKCFAGGKVLIQIQLINN